MRLFLASRWLSSGFIAFAVFIATALGSHLVQADPSYGPAEKTRSHAYIWSCSGSREFFDPIDGGSCWRCPADWYRTMAPVNTGRACSSTAAGVVGAGIEELVDVYNDIRDGFQNIRGACVSTLTAPAGNFSGAFAQTLGLGPLGEGVQANANAAAVCTQNFVAGFGCSVFKQPGFFGAVENVGDTMASIATATEQAPCANKAPGVKQGCGFTMAIGQEVVTTYQCISKLVENAEFEFVLSNGNRSPVPSGEACQSVGEMAFVAAMNRYLPRIDGDNSKLGRLLHYVMKTRAIIGKFNSVAKGRDLFRRYAECSSLLQETGATTATAERRIEPFYYVAELMNGTTSNPYWAKTPLGGKDVAVGADGSVWIVGLDNLESETEQVKLSFNPKDIKRLLEALEGKDSRLYKLNEMKQWDPVSGGGTRITVGPKNLPWVVTAKGDVAQMTDPRRQTWKRVRTKAKASDIASDGATVWITDRNGRVQMLYPKAGNAIDVRVGQFPNPFKAERIAVLDGQPWITINSDAIVMRTRSGWQLEGSQAKDLAFAPNDPRGWKISTETHTTPGGGRAFGYKIYRHGSAPGQWQLFLSGNVGAVAIAVGPDQKVGIIY